METSLEYQETLQFAQVYITDMEALKKIFLQAFPLEHDITAAFGVPFLLAKKEDSIVAFASLVLNAKEAIDFEVYNSPDMNADEKGIFVSFVSRYLKEKGTGNYSDPEQLKDSICRVLKWLN